MKTTRNDGDVSAFIAAVEHDTRRADAERLLSMIGEITGDAAAMWGDSIVGFGERHLVYESGREIDWFDVGFSPRKAKMVLYIMDGFDTYDEILSRLGKHSTGTACLYINRLENVDMDVLHELVSASVAAVRAD